MIRKINKIVFPIILACLTFTGCTYYGPSYEPVTSEGGEIRYVPDDEHSNSTNGFSIEYQNSVGFKRDLTISVDSIFARLKAKDSNAQDILHDFLKPAEQLLGDKYSIFLKFPQPVPDDQMRKFVVKTDYSQWQMLPSSHVNFYSQMKNIHNLKDEKNIFKVRGKVSYAEAKFNSFTPKKVYILSKFIIQMQTRPKDESEWNNVLFDRTDIINLAEQIRKDLNKAYYRYLKDTYDLEITSSGFGGFNEK